MFRALFRRPRSVRVPTEEGGHKVRPVRIGNGRISSELSPANFVWKCFVAYCIFRYIETTDIFGISKESKEAQEKIRRHKDIEANGQAGDDGSRAKIQKLIEQGKKGLEGGQEKSPAQGESKSLSDANQVERLRKVMERHQAAAAMEQAMTTVHTLPIWFRAKPRKLYTRDDQEYKDYVRLQSDEKKVQQLKEGVSQHIMERLKNHMHQRQLQHIKFNGTAAVVFELVPQLYAPTTYEVPCVVVKPSGIDFGWRQLSPELSTRFDNIFRPSIMYKASKASASALWKCTYAILGAKAEKHLGIKLPWYDPNFQLAVPVWATPDKTDGQQNAMSSNTPTKTGVHGLQQLTEAIGKSGHSPSCTQRNKDRLSESDYSTPVKHAQKVFTRVRLREQAAREQRQAPGVVQVRGIVVCLGETGKYKLDVLAYYVPREDAFLGYPMITKWYIVQDYAAIERLAEERKRGGPKAIAPKSLATEETKVKQDENETKPTEE